MEEIGEKILHSIYGGQDPLVSIFGSIGPDDIEKLMTEFQDSPWAQILRPPADKKVEENPWVKLFTNKAPCGQKENKVPCGNGHKVNNIPCSQSKEEPKCHSLWSQVLNKQQYPPVDIRAMETYIGVYIDLPGVSKNDIQLSVRGTDELIIEYERNPYSISSDTFVLKERPVGSFKRVIKLPAGIDVQPYATTHLNGVLEILFHKLSTVDDKFVKKINIS